LLSRIRGPSGGTAWASAVNAVVTRPNRGAGEHRYRCDAHKARSRPRRFAALIFEQAARALLTNDAARLMMSEDRKKGVAFWVWMAFAFVAGALLTFVTLYLMASLTSGAPNGPYPVF